MTPNIDTDGPAASPELILRYLLLKCDDETNPFDSVFVMLIVSLLSAETEFIERFKALLPSHPQPDEQLRLFIELATRTLTLLSETVLPEPFSETIRPNAQVSRQFLREAWRLGRQMVKTKCYEMLPVYRVLTCVGLYVDASLKQEFVERCCKTEDQEPEETILAGKEFIKNALFNRKSSSLTVCK